MNEKASKIYSKIWTDPEKYNVLLEELENGAKIIDAGINSRGGLNAGKLFAEISMAGLGDVECFLEEDPIVRVNVDQPKEACMLSQCAGWFYESDDFSAMISGPARAKARVEDLFKNISINDNSNKAIFCIESEKFPSSEDIDKLADECDVDTENVRIILAPTGSLVGSVQISSRVVESAVHKLRELGFDLDEVVSGMGMAPLAPVVDDKLEAMGRTNDCTIYGGDVLLFVRSDDDVLEDIVKDVPSNSSDDYGVPFREIMEKYDGDFLEIDKGLFAPGRIAVNNLNSGNIFRAGTLNLEVLEKSLGIHYDY